MSEQELGALVVDLDHLDLVLARARDLRQDLIIGPPDELPALRLARVPVSAEVSASTFVDPEQLDLLLAQLRWWCAGRFGGWTPEMGKDRDLENIFAFGHPKSLGALVAVPAEAPSAMAAPSGKGEGTGAGVTVVMLDVDPVEAQVVADSSGVPQVAGHGRFVEGVIKSLAPGAVIRPRKALEPDGRGRTWQVVKALAAAVLQDGAQVVNLSIGCRTSDGAPPFALRRAVEVLGERALLVAAAGNRWNDAGVAQRSQPTWPATLPGVVAVGAAGAPFSPRLPWVDYLAPGVDVVSTFLDGVSTAEHPREAFHGFAKWSGTSFAAAHVAGAVAAALSRPGPAPAAQPSSRAARAALEDLAADSGSGITRYIWKHEV
ncbi:S8/S53 family peptidase [Dactylosporangium sp. AC04546]|uniref:S8/S53 family peptidase n=1 Tax=Dactylosporangium sp. AC04546 TaxID=2862460 RepID=UPI001EDFCE26|nr:S8/S53 family peptidase [Dactylosporangium sp. AC04546]WVK79703.1 S8/S53 family peptidase [Dactylosporangium sp. AC04546]